MKAIRHFQTITKHKIYVMRECFRVGLYRDYCMICRNTVGQNFGSGADITREHEARTMQSGKKKDIHLHGCIIREEISIITNTGSIIMSMRERTEGF